MIVQIMRTARVAGADGNKFIEKLMTVGRGAEYFTSTGSAVARWKPPES